MLSENKGLLAGGDFYCNTSPRAPEIIVGEPVRRFYLVLFFLFFKEIAVVFIFLNSRRSALLFWKAASASLGVFPTGVGRDQVRSHSAEGDRGAGHHRGADPLLRRPRAPHRQRPGVRQPRGAGRAAQGQRSMTAARCHRLHEFISSFKSSSIQHDVIVYMSLSLASSLLLDSMMSSFTWVYL